MKLPENKREKFKDPKGILFEKEEKAFDYLKIMDYKKIITIGDVVSAEFLRRGYEPDLIIVDFFTQRSPADPSIKKIIEDYEAPEIRVKNSPGHLSRELLAVLGDLKEERLKIIIEGEEDLSIVPTVLNCPYGSLVAYGQPKKGIVFVEVNNSKKRQFEELFDLFEKI